MDCRPWTFFEADSAAALLLRMKEKLRQFLSGFCRSQALGANVGNAIAVGVCFIWTRLPGQISAEAVW